MTMHNIDDVTVFDEDSPPEAGRRTRYDKWYGIAARLSKIGQWFEWTDPPKQLTSARKHLEQRAPHCTVYRAVSGKVIVKCVKGKPLDLAVVPASSPVPKVNAAPEPVRGGWSEEARKAAGDRARKRAQEQLIARGIK